MNIGIDIGGSHIGVALVEKDKLLSVREEKITQEDRINIKQAIEDKIKRHIKSILQEQKKSIQEIEMIGISSAGHIRENQIYYLDNLGIDEYDLASSLKKEFSRTIKIANDAECAARAEKEFGYMKQYPNGLFLCLGTGIGGRFFEQGKLLDRYGTVGHMIIKRDGKLCTCGRRGCFERYCSMDALKSQVRERLKLGKQVSGKEILDMMKEKQEELQDILEEFISYLAIGICNVVNMLKPDIVCIGGSFAYYEEILLPKVISYIKENKLLDERVEKVMIKVAKFKNDAGMIGAANL